MALYESNYVRLGWLAGNPAVLSGRHVSRVAGDCELRLTVCERSRYTSTLDLTCLLGSDEALPLTAPDLRLRAYHDARLVEVQDPGAARDPAGRWACNMLLHKWLEYCVDRGHRFGAPCCP